MKARHYRDLQVWRRSMLLAREVFRVTADFPKAQTFALCSQMQRAAVSVPSNIAEGHGRLSNRSFALFLSQACGSLNELQTQTELAKHLAFADETTCTNLLAEMEQIAKMLNALLTAVRAQAENRGQLR
jgi:four helix bundle protein